MLSVILAVLFLIVHGKRLHTSFFSVYIHEIWKVLLSKLNLMPISYSDVQGLLDSVVFRIAQNCDGAITLGKLLFSAYVWHVWAERNVRIFTVKAKSSGTVVQHIVQVMTTKILYLGLRLPTAIQCHWNVPSNDQVIIRNLICDRAHGWLVTMTKVLVGIMWSDIHLPWKGQRVQLLNYYDVIFQLMQLVLADASLITIETDASLHKMLLHPYQSDRRMRFQA